MSPPFSIASFPVLSLRYALSLKFGENPNFSPHDHYYVNCVILQVVVVGKGRVFLAAMEGEPSQLKRAAIDASAGAISGGISRTVTSPLDVIKIRFQVSVLLSPSHFTF